MLKPDLHQQTRCSVLPQATVLPTVKMLRGVRAGQLWAEGSISGIQQTCAEHLLCTM